MRKLLVIAVSITLLMVGISVAQQPRDYADSRDNINVLPSEGLSVFTNVGVTGVDVDGVPGYIMMLSSSGKIFYLYIDSRGFLMIASGATVGTTASPNTTTWSNAGERVGSQ